MPVNDLHPEYEAHASQWSKLRDCIAGQEAIHAKGQAYLPKLSGQTDPEYSSYVARALFYGATSRTVDGLSGMIFRKPPRIQAPERISKMLEDITLTGVNLVGFAEDCVDNVIAVGRGGILVDHPSGGEQIMTQAEAEKLNMRPFLKQYRAESIINWKLSSVNNKTSLTEVRLYEYVEENTSEFSAKVVEQIRVLELSPIGYQQRIFRKKEADQNSKVVEWEQFGPPIIPLMNGKPLDFIPFVFLGVKNSSADVEKPPLIDLANVNLSHYMTTADLEHGAHFTGLPTAVISGISGEEGNGDTYRIGSATAWVFSNKDAKATYLEFEGKGLETLSERLKAKEEMMAFLGARMLAPDKKAAETAETANIHRMGEISVLASLSVSVSESIRRALQILCVWAGVDQKIDFELNKEFMPTIMSAQEITALMALWQGGGIAFEDLLINLKKGEIVQQDRTAEDIRSEVEQENPFSGQDMTGDLNGGQSQ